jgi:type II secretory pathway predicted ATPase ExeA
MSPGHEEVLTSIIYGIQNRRGIMAIIGEVGTGKTTLLNTALEWLARRQNLNSFEKASIPGKAAFLRPLLTSIATVS